MFCILTHPTVVSVLGNKDKDKIISGKRERTFITMFRLSDTSALLFCHKFHEQKIVTEKKSTKSKRKHTSSSFYFKEFHFPCFMSTLKNLWEICVSFMPTEYKNKPGMKSPPIFLPCVIEIHLVSFS